MRLNIVLWLWQGWRPIYSRTDINAVAQMLRDTAELPGSARILLLTDQPSDWASVRARALGVEEFPLWPDPVSRMTSGKPNCYRRLKIFDAAVQRDLGIAPGDIVMSMDADSIVSGPLVPLLSPLISKRHTLAAMGGVAARIHGSLFAFAAYSQQHLWDKFHPVLSPLENMKPWRNGPRPVGSDQAFMTRNVVGEYLWSVEDGCYSWNRHGCSLSPRYTENACYWSFAGHHKPSSELVRQVRPDLHAAYMRAYAPPAAAVGI